MKKIMCFLLGCHYIQKWVEDERGFYRYSCKNCGRPKLFAEFLKLSKRIPPPYSCGNMIDNWEKYIKDKEDWYRRKIKEQNDE